jgi:hypothetical protein
LLDFEAVFLASMIFIVLTSTLVHLFSAVVANSTRSVCVNSDPHCILQTWPVAMVAQHAIDHFNVSLRIDDSSIKTHLNLNVPFSIYSATVCPLDLSDEEMSTCGDDARAELINQAVGSWLMSARQVCAAQSDLGTCDTVKFTDLTPIAL